MTNKEQYRQFCKDESELPIFSKDWWLDCVCGEDAWDVVVIKKNGKIAATLPYCISSQYFFNISHMPVLTQTLGIYLKHPKGQSASKRLSWEKKIMSEAIEALPQTDSFRQNFNHSITNWLPFFWAGYEQSTKYTYIIEGLLEGEFVSALDSDVRRRVGKAIKAGITTSESDNVADFFELNSKTFQRQGKAMAYDVEFVQKLYTKCYEQDAAKIFFAKDSGGENIATSFIVYDERTVYYLMGGMEPSKSHLGGMNLALIESVKFALNSGRRFDFEGSMIEPIEKYFRSFGAKQKPYFYIEKVNSKLLKLRKAVSTLR